MNMHLNSIGILHILSSSIILSVGIYAYLKNRKNLINKNFFVFCVAFSIWQFCYGISYLQIDKSLAQLWLKIGYTGVIFAPTTYCAFNLAFLGEKIDKVLKLINYPIALFFVYLLWFTNLFTDGVFDYFWGYYPKAGNWHPYFMLHFAIIAFISLSLLIRKMLTFKHSPLDHIRYKYATIASVFAFSGGYDFIPNYGIEIYPIGWIFADTFIGLIAYSIIKHNLMELNIVLKKSIVYSTLIAIITIFYLIAVVLFENIIKNSIGYSSMFITMLIIFIIGIAFIPLRNKIQDLVDKIFFKATPIELAQQNEMLLKEVSEKERFKKVATLASGMAHEIKNPLTAIKTFTEYLEKHKNDPDFYTKFSKIVGKEVDRIDDLVHQLLEFSKPFPIELKQSDIVKLVDDTLAFLDSQFLKSNITVEKVYDLSNPILVNMDPVQIRQVIVNIFINAAEAMKFGGILTVTISTAKNQVIISTRDTGSGIAPEDLKHIFEPFFTKKDNGTGLGLSISYGIIEKHKGKIEVKSAVGIGTEFKIKLPMTKYLNENRLT